MDNQEEIKNLIYKFGQRALEDYRSESSLTLTGPRLVKYQTMLSGYSSILEEETGALEIIEAKSWPTFRLAYKTNEEAKRAWSATPEGIRQIEVKHLLKAVDKIVSSCKVTLRRMEMEMRNQS